MMACCLFSDYLSPIETASELELRILEFSLSSCCLKNGQTVIRNACAIMLVAKAADNEKGNTHCHWFPLSSVSLVIWFSVNPTCDTRTLLPGCGGGCVHARNHFRSASAAFW